MRQPGWQFWIDRGGTFTDVVAYSPSGERITEKLLSDNPGRYQDAAAEGIRRLLTSRPNEPRQVDAIKMGTTVATNALLERKGATTVFITTAGFGDSLLIGYQNRPSIFALNIQRATPLYSQVIEIDERIAADGSVLIAPDRARVRAQLAGAVQAGARAAAICLLHGYRYTQHERLLRELAEAAGFDHVSVSHDVEAVIKFVSRAETVVADAYLTPVLRGYVATFSRRTRQRRPDEPPAVYAEQRRTGRRSDRFRGKDSVLSGPAGGVVGMAEAAASVGIDRLIGFDMGGTSTDVSLFDRDYERTVDSEIAGLKLRSPMLKIHTIAAGGGSILRYRDERYQVGPESAGANPGPACYRRGGPLTVTDANVLLGRLLPEHFPSVFGKSGSEPLDGDIVEQKFRAIAASVSASAAHTVEPEDVANGFLAIAVEAMANAIRKITVERGRDARDYVLSCFGGAGGQHACQVAETLGVGTIWIHPLAGVLSAYGMGLANVRIERQRSLNVPMDERTVERVHSALAPLLTECRSALADQQVAIDTASTDVLLGLHQSGSDAVLDISFGTLEEMRSSFAQAYAERFGTQADTQALLVATLRVAMTGHEARCDEPTIPSGDATEPDDVASVWVRGAWRRTPVYARAKLAAGTRIDGPAILTEANATTFVDAGWRAETGPTGHLLLRRTEDQEIPRAQQIETADRRPDPVRLEIFNRLFMHVAEQMGVVLRNTAESVNIRERLDYSCALFDPQGQLVSNAPHMPVHLGSMGESVRAAIRETGATLTEGDVVMLNSPYNGGTHLPDITVITPWFLDGVARFFLASRAHHADIGGISPGSMPAASRHIDEEGVLFDVHFLVKQGRLQHAETVARLRNARYPARNVEQNVADLNAQLAANQQGIRELEKAIARYGLQQVQAYLEHVRNNAATSVRRLIGSLNNGSFRVATDQGDTIDVTVTVDHVRERAEIDFTGTSTQSPGNANAPEAVTRAAVLYVFRSLIAEEIPLNEGCLEPLFVRIPKGSLLSPSYPAAVVAGNVETSQAVTDALLGALGSLAASQGTMNNVSFGNTTFQYYETIAGGAGAGPNWHGADAIQTHMTNSRLTDPEVFESNYPVRLESFAIRRSSGGRGRFNGGNGAIRQILFLEPVELSLLSDRRKIEPFGLAGGSAGEIGRNTIIRADGSIEQLAGTVQLSLDAGDRLRIETPGGGGFGSLQP